LCKLKDSFAILLKKSLLCPNLDRVASFFLSSKEKKVLLSSLRTVEWELSLNRLRDFLSFDFKVFYDFKSILILSKISDSEIRGIVDESLTL